ncbi:MAG: hypothetical protein BGO29_04530 [Bacteroidales bacterium 36-12]|nr:MAG: hypothetical protein BGO29_04530 [Bacteroidales bacterium 36-12]
MYKIVVSKKAIKELEKIPKLYYKTIRIAIDNLENEPRPNGYKKLQGYDDTYRIRVGVYRIIYTIEDNILTIEVIKIAHRQSVYE